jgi:quinoprotein glucose dehydrogenase
VAIDPVTGQFRWERAVGYLPEARRANVAGYENMGSPVVGGAITTASGLTFLAGTRDAHFRAFASATGDELVSIPLPYVAGSLPMIYTVNGKEFVVICCGGHGFLRSGLGDHVMAFSL